MGSAVLNNEERIFIGSPLIEAARLEKGQRFIGASCCPSFMGQTIPRRFLLSFNQHLKVGYESEYGGFVLDWPRHWRNTRKKDVRDVVMELRNESGKATAYYDITLEMIAVSEQYQDQYESRSETSIRTVYESFAFPLLEASVMAVRNK